MEFFRILWHGMRDVYQGFAYYMLASFVFWLFAVPMLFGYGFLEVGWQTTPLFLLSAILVPPSLLTLFAATDPRRVVGRMDWREVWAMMRSSFGRSWIIALFTIVPLVILSWNIAFFAGSGEMLEVLIPLWFVMWVLLFVFTFFAFSLAGTHDSSWRNAFRGGLFVLVKYPFRAVFLTIFLLLFGYLFTMAVLPMLIIGPAFFAAIINRFVFDAFDVEVIDPDAPTNERADERARGVNLERSMMDRVFRRRGE